MWSQPQLFCANGTSMNLTSGIPSQKSNAAMTRRVFRSKGAVAKKGGCLAKFPGDAARVALGRSRRYPTAHCESAMRTTFPQQSSCYYSIWIR
jgi:hypothetical protein